MRTTIAIADALLQKAKRRAQQEGVTLGELIEAALRDRLLRAPAASAAAPFQLVTFGRGGLLPGLSFGRLKEAEDEEAASRLTVRTAARAADADDDVSS